MAFVKGLEELLFHYIFQDKSDEQVMHYLNGRPMDITDEDHQTPVTSAVSANRQSLVRRLLAAGYPMSGVGNYTAFGACMSLSDGETMEPIFRILLDHTKTVDDDFNCSFLDELGEPLTHVVCRRGTAAMIEMLKSRGMPI